MATQASSLAIAASFVSLLLITPPLEAAAHKITWFLGHKNLDYFEEAALEFKKTVETQSNGEISVDIVIEADDTASQDSASAPQIAALVAKGEAEMGHSFTDVIGSLDPRFYAFEAPYLFRNYRHMEGFFEGPLGAEVLDGMRRHGLVGLSFTYSGGANAVATLNREIRRPEDLQGLKVGVFGNRVNEAWLKKLGASPVAIAHNLDAILPAARDGRLDAVVITWRNFEQQELNSQFKYMNLLNSTYLVSVTYINEKFFESLPEKYRTLIMNASREAGRVERAKTIVLNEDSKLDMLGNGVRSVYLSGDSQRRFIEALKPAYKNSIDRIIGESLVNKIRSASDAPQHPAIPPYISKL